MADKKVIIKIEEFKAIELFISDIAGAIRNKNYGIADDSVYKLLQVIIKIRDRQA